jgi:hypothetical protein
VPLGFLEVHGVLDFGSGFVSFAIELYIHIERSIINRILRLTRPICPGIIPFLNLLGCQWRLNLEYRELCW